MSLLSINRIKTLREIDEAECISIDEIVEIQEAFNKIPDNELADERENAVVSDMLNELEAQVSPLEWAIYDYVVDNFEESEANDPSWDVGALANHLEGLSIRVAGEQIKLGKFLEGRM